MTRKAPNVGEMIVIEARGIGLAKVLAVHAFGTMDVESIRTGRCYRISGLAWVDAPASGWGAAVLSAGAL
jgi:hypothetical protein